MGCQMLINQIHSKSTLQGSFGISMTAGLDGPDSGHDDVTGYEYIISRLSAIENRCKKIGLGEMALRKLEAELYDVLEYVNSSRGSLQKYGQETFRRRIFELSRKVCEKRP